MTVLQSRLSGMYFKAFGYWVAHAAEAVHFHSGEQALQFAAEERLQDVSVRQWPEPSFDLPFHHEL